MSDQAVIEERNAYETEAGYLNVERLIEETKMFAFVVGARNIGKTYGFLKRTIEKSLAVFLEDNPLNTVEELENISSRAYSKYQFFFLRRYKTLIKEASVGLILEDFYSDFMKKIGKEIHEQFECYVDYEGNAEGVRRIYFIFEDKEDSKYKKKILIGHLSAVSAAEAIRKTGYPYVKIIIFDEFQSKKVWDYIQDEPRELLDIYESIARERVQTGDCKMFALGNSGTIMNPYFAFFGYNEFTEIKTDKRNGTAIFYHLPNRANNKKSGMFRDLIMGTAYGDYSINNEFNDFELYNVIKLSEAKEPRQCKYTIILNRVTLGIWKDGEQHLILSRLVDPELPVLVDSLPSGKQKINTDIYLNLVGLIREKHLYYDSPDIRLTAEKHLQRYMYKTTSDWEGAK